ncbi:MAG: TIGR04388 family protein [bacterium]|nr:TIGR04388 family protein [bacterium]
MKTKRTFFDWIHRSGGISSKRRSARANRIPSGGTWLRIMSGMAMLGLLLTSPEFGLRAQPVPVPTIGTPGFQATDFDPYFNSARGSKTQAGWETLIDQARIVLGGQWEAQVDAAIDAQVAAVGHSDFYNTTAEYRDYLRGELAIQKQTAFAAWEAAADAQIETQRVAFLTELGAAKERETSEASASSVQQGEAAAQLDSTSEAEVRADRRAWEREFEASFSDGLFQFQTALSELQQEYAALTGAIDLKEQEFAAVQARIDAYEANVRTGIQAATSSMQSYLRSSGVFYDWNCDGANNCSIDYNSPTAAAAQMQTLIDQLNDGLQNDQPLSVLANTMFTAVETQRDAAEAERLRWVNQSTGTNTYDTTVDIPDNSGSHAKNLYGRAGIGDAAAVSAYINSLKARGDVGAVVAYYQSGSAAGLINFADGHQASRGNPQHTITSITGVNLVGTNPLPSTFAFGVGGGGGTTTTNTSYRFSFSVVGNRNYAQVGDEAFLTHGNTQTTHTICTRNPRGGPSTCSSSTTQASLAHKADFRITIDYTWEDANARHNADIWQGYVNDLDPVVAKWRDDILPAIQNWEAQTATFEADYAAWQTEAAQQRANAATAYESSVNEIIGERNRWISTLQQEFRSGNARWEAIQQGKQSAASAPAPGAVTRTLDSREFVQAVRAGFGGQVASASNLLNRGNQNVPDFALVSNLSNDFRRTGRGLSQLGLASELNNRIQQQRTEATNQIVSLLTQDHSIYSQAPAEQPDVMLKQTSTVSANATYKQDSAGDTAKIVAKTTAATRPAPTQTGPREVAIQIDAFSTNISSNGSIRASRQIHSGRARHARGDGKSAEDYDAEYTEQAIEIAPPPPVKMVETGSLFDDWGDARGVVSQYEENVKENQALLDAKFKGSQQVLQQANQTAVDNFQRFQGDIQAQIKRKKKKQGLMDQLTSIATAMFSGGISLQQAVTNHMQNKVSAKIAEVTGWPSSIFSSMMGGMSAQDAVKDYVKTETDNIITTQIAKATGLPAGFISGMVSGGSVDFGGESMKNAFEAYTDELFAEKLEEGTGIPGLAGFLKRTTIAKRNAKKAATEAAKPKPEDLATGGATYVWRNADHNKDMGVALQAAETVAGAAAVGTGWGTAAFAGYMAAKGAYKGYLAGDSNETILKKAAVAGGSAVINHYTSKFGASVNLTYDEEGGFGGSVSGSIPIKGTPLNVGGSLSFQEGQGITGGGLTAGLAIEGGGSINAGANFAYDSATGQATSTGGSLSAGYNTDSGFGGSASVNFNGSGNVSSVSAELTYKTKKDWKDADGKNRVGASGTHTAGMGLTINADQSYAINAINRVSGEDSYGIGVNSASASGSLSVNYDATGAYAGHSSTQSAEFGFQTQSEKEETMSERLAELEKKFLETPELGTQEELEEYNALRKRNDKENRGIASKRYVDRLVHQGKLTPEQAEELRKDPSKWHTEAYAMKLRITGDSADSRTSTWDKITGTIGDAGKWLIGDYSTADGYLDPENGELVARTCFVAGTPVRVHPETRNAFQLNGGWYKAIEKIEIGDRALSWNETSGKTSYNTVTETFTNQTTLIFELSYADGTKVETTWNHPFYISGRGWTEVKDLRVGDVSIAANTMGGDAMLAGGAPRQTASLTVAEQNSQRITRIRKDRRDEIVYNIEVDGDHTYFVSESNILVHNYVPAIVAAVALGVAIGGGVDLSFQSAEQYRKTGIVKTENFDYLRTGITATVGGLSGGLGSYVTSSMVSGGYSVAASTLVGSATGGGAGGFTGQVANNVYDGKKNWDIADGVVSSTVMGTAGGAFLGKYMTPRFTAYGWNKGGSLGLGTYLNRAPEVVKQPGFWGGTFASISSETGTRFAGMGLNAYSKWQTQRQTKKPKPGCGTVMSCQ